MADKNMSRYLLLPLYVMSRDLSDVLLTFIMDYGIVIATAVYTKKEREF